MLSDVKNFRCFCKIILSLWLTLITVPVFAEPEAISNEAFVVSDRLEIDPSSGHYIFSGDVEIYFDGLQLNAAQVTYDLREEMVEIVGPFQLIEADGVTKTYGDFAELASDLETGVLFAVKRVIDDSLRVEAAEVTREAGRYSRFKAIRASTCKICIESKEPLWELVAADAYHDSVEKHVTYRKARLLIRGFTVAYLPWVRVPDPTVTRADGFLAPVLRFNSALGNQLTIPYFKALGNAADLTLAPHVPISGFQASSLKSQTLEARYRQIFQDGYLELNGAISSDDLKDKTRAYLFSKGDFKFTDGYQIKFQTQSASDKSYLNTYRFHASPRETFTGTPIQFNPDRLSTQFRISPVSQTNGLQIEYEYFQPLLNQSHVYETANKKLNFKYSDDYSLDEIPGKIKLSSGIQLYHNEFGSLNVNKQDISRASVNVFWSDNHQYEQFHTYYELGTFIDTYTISDNPSYNGSKSGLGYYYSGKIERPIPIFIGGEYSLNLKPSVTLTGFDLAEYHVPEIVDSDIDLIDPYNAGNLERLHRFDRAQNHGDGITNLMLAFPVELKLPLQTSVNTNIEKDFIISSQTDKLIEDGLIYSVGFGRNGPGLNFTVLNKFDDEFTNIYNDTAFSLPFRSGSVRGGYRYRSENQVFQSTGAVEDWSLGFSLSPFDVLTLDLSTRLDEIEPTQSHSDLFISYGDISTIQGNLNIRYNRYNDNIEERIFNLSKTVLGDGNVYFKYTDRFEISEVFEVGLSYHNECMQFDIGFERYIDEVADRNSIDDLTFMIRMGSFGNKGKSSCS